MDKRVYVLASLLVLGGLGYYMSQPKCKESTERELLMAQMICYENLDKVQTKKELCQALRQTDECELYADQDGAAVEAFITKKIQPCANDLLATQGFCKKESK
jgi:hypothetical protein